jgi:hypothetical protein
VRATPFALFLVAAAVLVLATGQALTTAAPINLAIDFDSDNGVGGVRTGAPVVTQPGFLSWDASVFLPNAPLPRPFYQLVTQGVTFDVWFRRPSTPGSIVTPQSYGSRVRSGGGPLDDLLQDFIFAEGDSGNFIYLIARGLPVSSYRMTTWHFDSPLALACSPIRDPRGMRVSSARRAKETQDVDEALEATRSGASRPQAA